MDCETGSRKRLRLNPHAKALRRTRIFACLRSGWSYEAIAREEKVTPRRIRQIVGEVLKRREVDAGPDHAMLQLARLEGALRLTAERVAAGDIGAIGVQLKVLERLDRYRGGAAPIQAYDAKARARLLAKLNRVAAQARSSAAAKPSAPAADAGAHEAGAQVEKERIEAFSLDPPASH
jgi:hypothetical protein